MSITLRSKENYCMGRMGSRLCIQTTTACNGKICFRNEKIGFTSIKFLEISTDDPNDPNFVDLQEFIKELLHHKI